MNYPPSYIEKLRRFNAFLVIYVPYFQTAQLAADAQYEDLAFRRRLEDFKSADAEVAAVALEKFNRHVDFLSPQ